MPGMKRDCGGAAAILGAFKATVKQVLVILIADRSLAAKLIYIKVPNPGLGWSDHKWAAKTACTLHLVLMCLQSPFNILFMGECLISHVSVSDVSIPDVFSEDMYALALKMFG